jgi:hypothetical protein
VPQLVPSVLGCQALVETVDLQIWHWFAELTTPLPTSAPPSQQPLLHVAALHTWPLPQLVPLVRVCHALVETEGWQAWQGLAELATPLATRAPPNQQPALHVPPLHTWPLPQVVPLTTVDHPVARALG